MTVNELTHLRHSTTKRSSVTTYWCTVNRLYAWNHLVLEARLSFTDTAWFWYTSNFMLKPI